MVYCVFAWITPALVVITSVTLDKKDAFSIGYGTTVQWKQSPSTPDWTLFRALWVEILEIYRNTHFYLALYLFLEAVTSWFVQMRTGYLQSILISAILNQTCFLSAPFVSLNFFSTPEYSLCDFLLNVKVVPLNSQHARLKISLRAFSKISALYFFKVRLVI